MNDWNFICLYKDGHGNPLTCYPQISVHRGEKGCELASGTVLQASENNF